MTFKRDEEKFREFVELYDLSPQERLERGIHNNKDIWEQVGITEQCFYRWKGELENIRKDPDEDDFNECMTVLRELAFGRNGEKPKGLGLRHKLALI